MKNNKSRRIIFVSLALALLFLLDVCGVTDKAISLVFGRNENYDYVRFLDIGQADCTLIHTSGKYLLIDAGNNNDDGFKVERKLRSFGVSELEAIIVSHGDSDHAGGLYRTMQSVDVKRIICSDSFFDECGVLADSIKNIASENVTEIITAKAGDTFSLGNTKIYFIWHSATDNANDSSLVALADCGGVRIFFGGDISRKTEQEIINSGISVDCDILKASHHGSNGSSCDTFLSEASPEYCVACCGKDNIYGFPAKGFCERISAHGIKLYTTAQNGDITVNTEDKSIFCTRK